MIKKPMMAKRTTKAAPAKKKTVAAKKKTVAAKKPMTVAGKTVKKYQVGGPAMGSPRANPTATVGMQRPTITPGMTAPQMRQAYGQSAGMNRAEAQRRNASMATPAARSASGGFLGGMLARQGMTPRPGMGGSMIANNGGGLIPNNSGGMGRGMPVTPAQFEQSLGADRNNYVRNERGDFFLRPPPGTTPAQAEQMYRAQMARLQAMQQGAGGSMIANNGGGMMSPPNSRPRPVPMNQPVITPPPRLNIPGITPPMNRPVRTPPQPQGMPQGMSPAMQQYAQMMQQRQGMQGLGAAQGRRTYYPEFQEQGLFHEVSPQEQQRRMQMVGSSPRAIDMPPQERMDPAMQQQSMQGMQRMEYQPPQPLTQEQLQQLQQFGTPLPRFRKGGEAKKKAAAQGRMAKPAGRGRTTKPAVRGRMAKPTRGKK